jgi:hypothetical protein
MNGQLLLNVLLLSGILCVVSYNFGRRAGIAHILRAMNAYMVQGVMVAAPPAGKEVPDERTH